MLGSVTSQNVALAGLYGDDKGSGAPANVTARLYEGDPTDSGTEIAGTGYAAVVLANTTAIMGTPSGGQLGPITVDYGTAGDDDWGSPDFLAFDDGAGNLYDVLEISDPDTISNGDPVVVTVTITAS